jgi:hypothetical protein
VFPLPNRQARADKTNEGTEQDDKAQGMDEADLAKKKEWTA